MWPEWALRHPLNRTDPRPRERRRGVAMDDDDGRGPTMPVGVRPLHVIGFETERGGLGRERCNGFGNCDPAFRRTASAGEKKADHRRSSFQDFSRLAAAAATLDCAFLNVTSGRNVATTRARPNSTRSAMTRSMFL